MTVASRDLRPDELARYGRQVLLRGVGREGQARVLAATAAVDGTTLAHRVARLYAVRAGFLAVEEAPIAVERAAPEALVRHRAAREVLAGARAALVAFRRAAMESVEG